MKKVIMSLLVAIFLVTTANAAMNACSFECSAQKNIEMQEVFKIKKDLSSCRPIFLNCMEGDRPLTECRREMVTCKESGKLNIKDTIISANNNYNACLKSCKITDVQTIAFEKESGFCYSLKQNKMFFENILGEIRFQQVLSKNNCRIA